MATKTLEKIDCEALIKINNAPFISLEESLVYAKEEDGLIYLFIKSKEKENRFIKMVLKKSSIDKKGETLVLNEGEGF